MKKTLRFLPALLIAGAAVLCLSFDNNGKLFSQNVGEAELYETSHPTGSYKVVYDICPAPNQDFSSRECLSGGGYACTSVACPTTVSTETVALD